MIEAITLDRKDKQQATINRRLPQQGCAGSKGSDGIIKTPQQQQWN